MLSPVMCIRLKSVENLFVVYLMGCFLSVSVYLGFVFLIQADILEQLILELEHSVRTTGGYPGRYDFCVLNSFMSVFWQREKRDLSLSLSVGPLAIEPLSDT